MPAARDVQFLMQAAEQAAGAGQYVSAREYLREAIALQEADGGPTHPDLADALNNLGVVYEREGRLAEAEDCYRRAYAIASAAFAPDHPSLVVSARNLHEFCEANGLPFDAPAGSPTALVSPAGLDREARPSVSAAEAAGSAPLTRIAPLGSAVPTASSQPPPAHGTPTGLLVVAGLVIGALLAIGFIAMRSRPTTSAARPDAPAPVARPKPVSKARNEVPRKEATRKPISRAAAVSPVKAAGSAGSAPTLAAAELCRTLQTRDRWQCAPAAGTLQPGTLFFYTRLLSQTDTTVEHRWYRGERLHQAIRLRVRANSGAGFRTYSRMTVSAARTGDWRVELCTTDGTVLHEKRFTVGDH